jgi:hypothetical protein
MQVDDKLADLAPGMAVTVEIKTGQRRIIEYVLGAVAPIQAGELAGEVRHGPMSSSVMTLIGRGWVLRSPGQRRICSPPDNERTKLSVQKYHL